MSDKYDIRNNHCEICQNQSYVCMTDNAHKLHYSCLNHVTELWDKLGKPQE
jgi:hypothetical protein